ALPICFGVRFSFRSFSNGGGGRRLGFLGGGGVERRVHRRQLLLQFRAFGAGRGGVAFGLGGFRDGGLARRLGGVEAPSPACLGGARRDVGDRLEHAGGLADGAAFAVEQ